MFHLIEEALEWLNAGSFGARAIGSLLVLVLGVAASALVHLVLSRSMRKFLKLLDRRSSGGFFQSSKGRHIATELLPRAAFWIGIVFTLILGIQKLAGIPLVEAWTEQVVNYLPKILTAFVILLIGVWGGMIFKETVVRVGSAGGLSFASALGSLVQAATVTAAAVIALHQIGVDLTFLTVLAGVTLGAILFGGSLAFGLGARSMVENIIACHYVQKLYRVGMTVEIDGVRGVIIEMGSAFVVVENSDGRASIPASRFSDSISRRIDSLQD